MGQYCDSRRLEENWFHWLVAGYTPTLEPYRALGLLWTRPLAFVSDPPAHPVADPRHPAWAHCIAVGRPVYLVSDRGVLSRDPERDPLATLPHPAASRGRGAPPAPALPDPGVIGDLGSEDPILRLEEPYWVQGRLVPSLLADGYFLERPTASSWDALIRDVALICLGVARKFNQPDDEARGELAQEALTQVLRKLVERKLVYVPGRAPVFNLLTTTIHRIMFSVMNKHSKTRKNVHQLASDLRAGALPRSLRSLRVPGGSIKPR